MQVNNKYYVIDFKILIIAKHNVGLRRNSTFYVDVEYFRPSNPTYNLQSIILMILRTFIIFPNSKH